MKRIAIATLIAASLGLASSPSLAHEAHTRGAPKLENLMRSQLERVADTEVIVSRVSLAPNASLPEHWHPGEEFAYVLEGSVTLSLKGKGERVVRAGEAARIPLAHVHSARAGKQGCVVLVFRVHETGKPERVLVK